VQIILCSVFTFSSLASWKLSTGWLLLDSIKEEHCGENGENNFVIGLLVLVVNFSACSAKFFCQLLDFSTEITMVPLL